MARTYRLRSAGLVVLAVGALACGCSGKRTTPSASESEATKGASNALVKTPTAPSPIPIPYPNTSATSAATRDVATGQASGKRLHDPVMTVK